MFTAIHGRISTSQNQPLAMPCLKEYIEFQLKLLEFTVQSKQIFAEKRSFYQHLSLSAYMCGHRAAAGCVGMHGAAARQPGANAIAKYAAAPAG
jgi:hypothetical protein